MCAHAPALCAADPLQLTSGRSRAPACLSPPLQVFQVLAAEGINMQMLSQGSSKTNISMVVDSSQGKRVVQLLHKEFFEHPVCDPQNN